jgi:hypothetical protein
VAEPKTSLLVRLPDVEIRYALTADGKRVLLEVASPDRSINVNDAHMAIRRIPGVRNVTFNLVEGIGILLLTLQEPLRVGNEKLSLITSALVPILRATRDPGK